MKKNLFLRLCLVMTVALFLNSCRQDILPEQETYNNSSSFQLTSKKISLEEAQHKSKLLPVIEQVETGLKIKSNLQGKTMDYGNGVSIDIDDVIYIENGTGFHSYTFNIQHNNAAADAPVENLLLRSLPDGTYKEFLVAYNFTAQEKQIIMSGGYVNTNGKTTVTELASGTYSGVLAKSSCSYETVTINIPCTSKEHHMPGQKCDMTGNDAPRSFTMVALVCGADTSLGDDGEPGGGVSIGNVGGLGSGNPEGTPTAPNLPIKPIVNLDAGLDLKIKCLLQKMAGDVNITDDKITLPKNSTTDDLFQKMLRKFNGVDAPQLTFKYDPTLTATSGAYAKGTSLDGGITYQVIVGEGLVQSSNIRIMTTLAHELTHVFMLNELFQLNMIEWMPNGEPRVPNNIAETCTTNHEFSGDSEHFFAELLCYYIDHPSPQLTPQNQIFHDFFGILDNNFKTEAYVHKLAEYVKNSYDWNSESAGWTSVMQTKYGNDWKDKVAMNLQLDAIRRTFYFTTVSNQTHEQFHSDVVSIIDNGHLPNSNNSYPANKNCN